MSMQSQLPSGQGQYLLLLRAGEEDDHARAATAIARGGGDETHVLDELQAASVDPVALSPHVQAATAWG